MKVHLLTDGRVFDDGGRGSVPDGPTTYEVGDVAWFEEDILLVVAVNEETNTASAIPHPAAAEMMHTALNFGPKGPDRVKYGVAEAMHIHGTQMARRYLDALSLLGMALVGLRTAVDVHGADDQVLSNVEAGLRELGIDPERLRVDALLMVPA